MAVLFAMSIGAMPKQSLTAEQVYYYVDESGVYHFSNVPADARYKLLAPGAGAGPIPLPPAAAKVPAHAGTRPQAVEEEAVPSTWQPPALPGEDAIREELEAESESKGR